MVGEMHNSLEGDLDAWLRRLRPAVGAAFAAAKTMLEAARPKRMQSAADAAAFASLFAADVRTPVQTRLATQLELHLEDPVVVAIMNGLPKMGARAALLAIRGATNSVVTGARLQLSGAQCAFCHVAADSLAHFMVCPVALDALCSALGCCVQPHLALVLRASSDPPPERLWAAFVDLVSTTSASRSEVVARAPTFVSTAAAALARVHVATPAALDAAKARRAPSPAARSVLIASDVFVPLLGFALGYMQQRLDCAGPRRSVPPHSSRVVGAAEESRLGQQRSHGTCLCSRSQEGEGHWTILRYHAMFRVRVITPRA